MWNGFKTLCGTVKPVTAVNSCIYKACPWDLGLKHCQFYTVAAKELLKDFGKWKQKVSQRSKRVSREAAI